MALIDVGTCEVCYGTKRIPSLGGIPTPCYLCCNIVAPPLGLNTEKKPDLTPSQNAEANKKASRKGARHG